MTQKDPIWPVRELMGYRPLLPAAKRSTVPDNQSAGAIEALERRSMISGPMSIALAAAIAPASEMHLPFEGNDDSDSSRPDGTVAALADSDEAISNASSENRGVECEDAVSKCRPELRGTKVLRSSKEDELSRTYTLATIDLPATQHVRHQRHLRPGIARESVHGAVVQPDLALQIMSSGVAIDFDQAAEVSAMLSHHRLLPGIVFNPVAGIAALVA